MPDKPTGYCPKCKQSMAMDDAVMSRAKNNKPMLKGQCSECGTNIMTFISEEYASQFTDGEDSGE